MGILGCTLISDADIDGKFAADTAGDTASDAASETGGADTAGDTATETGGDDTALGANVDDDGDSYTEADGDCDDSNAAISPVELDVPDDGIDQNCSGVDFGLAACIESKADAYVAAYTFLPGYQSGTQGSDCFYDLSYYFSEFAYRVSSATTTTEADAGTYTFSVDFTADLNDAAAPYNLTFEQLCSERECEGYVTGIVSNVTGTIDTNFVTDGGETSVEAAISDARFEQSFDDAKRNITCTNHADAENVLGFFGLSEYDVTISAASEAGEALAVMLAAQLDVAIEADCRD